MTSRTRWTAALVPAACLIGFAVSSCGTALHGSYQSLQPTAGQSTPTPPASPTASPSATPSPSTLPVSAACEATVPQNYTDVFSTSVTLTTQPDGLQVGDIHQGCGPAVKDGETVTVEYTGWLTNGTEFDSSRKPGRQPFSFVVGQGQVIQGWDRGVVGMQIGTIRRLVIPPSLGYGSTAQGSIPANSTLVFNVELLSIAS